MFKKLLISGLLLLSFSVFADTLQVGSTLSAIELNTQHGKSVKVANDVKTLIFSVEKAPSDLINSFLMKQDAKFLANNKAYFIADISRMPSMITKMFAIPKMKKRPYNILLAKNETQVAFIPRKKEFVSVLKIAGGKVTAVEFVNNVDQLAKAFK